MQSNDHQKTDENENKVDDTNKLLIKLKDLKEKLNQRTLFNDKEDEIEREPSDKPMLREDLEVIEERKLVVITSPVCQEDHTQFDIPKSTLSNTNKMFTSTNIGSEAPISEAIYEELKKEQLKSQSLEQQLKLLNDNQKSMLLMNQESLGKDLEISSLMNEIQKLKEITDSQNQTIEKLKMQNLELTNKIKSQENFEHQVQLQRKVIKELQEKLNSTSYDFEEKSIQPTNSMRLKTIKSLSQERPSTKKIKKNPSNLTSVHKILPNRSAKKLRNCYVSVRMDDISTLKAYPKTLLDSIKKKKPKKDGLKKKLKSKLPLHIPRPLRK